MTEPVSLFAASAEAQERLGGALATECPPAFLIYLQGDLGAGKTTFARGFLRALGYAGPVRSPTYTLVEPYATATRQCYHFDLYRLADPEELEYLGLRDILAESAVLLAEWPENGRGLLPEPDLELSIGYRSDGRELRFSSRSARGAGVLAAFAEKLGGGIN